MFIRFLLTTQTHPADLEGHFIRDLFSPMISPTFMGTLIVSPTPEKTFF